MNSGQKILLFDFDGTIADSADLAVKIYNQIAEKSNYKLITKENLVFLRNRNVRENLRHMGIPFWKLPYLVKEGRAAFRNEVSAVQPIEGVSEALQVLKNKGHQLFILSSNSEESIQKFLDLHDITEFQGIYSVSRLLGKHTKIKELMKKNKWESSLVLYIGDEVRDIEAAKKAGIVSGAVTWGYNSKEVLEKSSPDILIHEPGELRAL